MQKIENKTGIEICLNCKNVRFFKEVDGKKIPIPPSCEKMFSIITGEIPECRYARVGADYLLLKDHTDTPKDASFGSYAMKAANRCGIEAKWFEKKDC